MHLITNKDEEVEKIFDLIYQEYQRQNQNINLIASENFVSNNVLKAQGSILTNKYAEGYINKRFYNGCPYIDQIEKIAIKKATELFKSQYANVQPHSGSQANAAVFQALLNPNDKILGLNLESGGHLTHGSKMNFSGKYYQAYFYNVEKKTEMIDYEQVRQMALKIKPKLIIAGASAYSRIINFNIFRQIANEVNAYLMADIAHIAGLIVCGLHPCPLQAKADIVTTTTHKTLRGPRGGLILTNNLEIIKKVNQSIFPGSQGGPLMHIIAAKAIAFQEALKPNFVQYQKQTIKNAQCLANNLKTKGYRIVSQQTDNHLFLIDLKSKNKNFTGKKIADILQKVNIIVNKNMIPFDNETPLITSGIRLGTPAMTTRNFRETEFTKVAHLIDQTILNQHNEIYLKEIKNKVINLTQKFPLNYEINR